MNLGGVIRLNKVGLFVMFGALFVLFVYMLTSSSSSNSKSLKINLKHLLEVAIKAAENGGKEVVRNKDNLSIKSKGLTKEGLQDSVTTADYLSHCAIMKTLNHAYPTLKIISEETKVDCDKNQDINYLPVEVPTNVAETWEELNDVTVWIDPLDATYEYTGKSYQYVTTMVCVAVKGKPIIGVIHKPFLKSESQIFWGWVGVATSKNLNYVKPVRDNLKIIVSLSHSGEVKKVLNENFKDFELISAAGAGYKSLEVAMGNVDAYIHITAIKKWDICAGNAIINALGGKMTTTDNGVIDYKDETNVKNDKGLIATMENHDLFLGKL